MINSKAQKAKSKLQLKKSVVASFVGTLGSSIFSFGLGLMILKVTGSALSFSFSLMVGPLVALLLMPITGSVVDRFSHKKIILISQGGTILLLLLYFFYTYFTQTHFFLASALLIIGLRISDQFTDTAQAASKVQVVLTEDLMPLAGYQQTASSMVGLFSSLLGAILYGILPFYLFVIFELISELITYILTVTLDFSLGEPKEVSAPSVITKEDSSFKAGLKFISRQKFLIIFLVIGASLNFFNSVLNVGLTLILLNGLKTSTFQLGIFDTLFSLGLMLSGILIGKLKPANHIFQQFIRLSYLIGICYILMGSSLMLPISSGGKFAFLLVLAFFMGIVLTFINVPVNVWLQKSIPQSYQGRVFSVLSVISSLLMPLGVMVYGFLFDLNFMPLLEKSAFLLMISGLLMGAITLLIVKISHVDVKHPEIILPK